MTNTTPSKRTRYSAFAPRQVLYAAGNKVWGILLLISMFVPFLNILIILIFFFVWWFKWASWINDSSEYTPQQKEGIIWFFNKFQTIYLILFILSLILVIAYWGFIAMLITSGSMETLWTMWGGAMLDPAMLEMIWGLEWMEGLEELRWLEWLEALGELAEWVQ